MTTIPSLEVLKQNREALLMAEVAALLHDIGKFCNLHIEAHTKDGTREWANDHAYKAVVDDPAKQIRLSRKANALKKPDALKNILGAGHPKAADFLDASLKDFLSNNSLTILGETYTLAELIMLGTPGFATDPNRPNLLEGKSGWLAAVLGVCHNEAHVDKQDPATGEGDQTWLNVFISDAFGYEKEQVIVDNSQNSLDARLLALRPNAGRQAIVQQLCYGLGDTRRPVNEVLLSDWGWIVASLFKSALAGAVIKNQQAAIGQWKSWKDKIIDHGLHWRILRVNFDVLRLYAKAIKIADLLAYQNAVDETCQKVKNLVEEEYPLGNEIYRDTTGIYFTFPDLDLPGDLAQEIRRRVEGVEPELVPRIAVTVGDGATAQEQLKSILGKARREALQNLKQPFDAVNLSPVWQQVWEKVGTDEKKWEVCPLCGLRPKEEHAEVCAHCEQRRASRLNVWKQNPARTIWLGEIADHNDRVALLVGKFGLEDWLSGDLVQTMLVKAVENNPGACVPKNPSPARLRRVWETCQRFWDDAVLQEILAQKLGNRGQRKRIVPDRTEWQPGLYNGKVNGKPLDLFWQPEYKAFLTISNLQASGALQQGDLVSLEHPESKQKAEFQIQAICEAPAPFDHYISFLSLPASPDQFLAFIPAADALDIIQEIQKQYAEQFGKVRNRLSLFLGLIYFERKMPLMAVMDAARQMLNAPLASESWHLKATDGKGHVEFENGITWDLPTKMGDGKTEDCWYPYFELTDLPASPRAYQFQHNGKTWVHVKNMQQGDTVRLTPSRFDFEFLDTNARRFEIYYDENGRRLRPTRPFYLEDLERLEKLWKYMERLTKTQRHQVIRTIEGTRERWYGNDNNGHSITDEVFRQFVHDTLAGASWPKGQSWSSNPQEWQEKLVQAGVRGELSDLAELHMEILKEKGGRDGNL